MAGSCEPAGVRQGTTRKVFLPKVRRFRPLAGLRHGREQNAGRLQEHDLIVRLDLRHMLSPRLGLGLRFQFRLGLGPPGGR